MAVNTGFTIIIKQMIIKMEANILDKSCVESSDELSNIFGKMVYI